jgi:hypothetical protein
MADAVRLTAVPTAGEAEIICSLLRAHAIPCFERPAIISGESAFRSAWWTEVLIPENALEDAQALLASTPETE